MSEFEKWLEENYPIAGLDMCEKEGDRYTHKPTRNMHDAYLAGQQTKEAAIQEMDEVIKLQDADLRKYEKQIEGLKEQLNNMEACYIEKKKEVEELQGKSRCIKSLVEQRNLAENMLRKISVAAQKKLPTFGAALRFNNEVKEILRGAND